MKDEHALMLERFVKRFGLPDQGDHLAIFVWKEGADRRDYPAGRRLYAESDIEFVYEMMQAGLVSIHDHRAGDTFDGPYGLDPGMTRGKPTEHVSIIICDDEASAWLDERRT